MKKHIPNIITCCNLLCGCVAIGAGFYGNFSTAFLFILCGALFDFFDGMVARLLGVSGPMGVELDSLADVVTFGVAPSAMIFTLYTKVYYPEIMYSNTWFTFMPYTAFLVAAFSALRLAKFNIDERQHTSFIGMPTPANAIFWAALISSSTEFLTSARFNAPFLFAFEILFCWLLVCEVPMFSLKFKNFSWAENKLKFIFLIICAAIILCSTIFGLSEANLFRSVSQGLAGCIGVYLFLSICSSLTGSKD